MTISYQEALENFRRAEEELEKARKAELVEVIKEIKLKINRYQLTAEMLGLKTAEKKASVKKSEPKYICPSNPNKTWSGKGRNPDWVIEHIKNGGKLEELEIFRG